MEINLEKILESYLEDASLEDFLEEHNITPLEAVELLYDAGCLLDDLLEKQTPVD